MKMLRLFAALATLILVSDGSAGGRAQNLAKAKPAPPKQLVILDTDIGDDIDDAFALALVLRSPEIRLLGIETAYGDTHLRARLVDRYLRSVGASVPVAAGVPTEHKNVFSQAAYAKQEPTRKHMDAVAFLLGQIRAHPNQITVIAIGPLSNIGAAIRRDPATFKQLKRVVIMGGSVNRGYDAQNGNKNTPPSAEWNIVCDPAGAKALFASGVPIFAMPLDSTQVHLEEPALGSLLAHGSLLTDQLTLLYRQWTGAGQGHFPTLYDPVAVSYVIRPDLCPASPIRIEVDDKGFTKQMDGAPNAQVCLHLDEKAFLNMLLGRITADPSEVSGKLHKHE